jgi:DNA-3-methyladenine glycosylase I
MNRCAWCKVHPLLQEYHDKEWGVPVHDDKRHYEFLILEAAQAGLSWLTVLKRRQGYKKAFAQYDWDKVAKYDSKKIKQLIKNPGIIRNRLKIESAIHNAKAFQKVREEFGNFDKYLWNFVQNKTINNSIRTMKDLPAKTPLSDDVSRDLKRRGFKFVGSTVIYAHLQAVGIINDHENTCFRKKPVSRSQRAERG